MLRRTILPTLAIAATLTAVAFASSGHARGSQGYLGVGLRDVSQQQAANLHLKEVHGVEIVIVDHDGPAGKAGLRAHDIILQMSGKFVEGAKQLSQMLQSMQPGKVVNLLIFRDGKQQTVTAQLADKSAIEKQAWDQHMTVPEPPDENVMGFREGFVAPLPDPRGQSNIITTVLSPSYTGALLETLSPQLAEFFGAQTGNALLVRSVEQGSPAAIAGMRAGDVIVRVGSTIIASPTDWTHMMIASRGKPITVIILRDKHEETLTITPDARQRTGLERPVDPLFAPLTTLLGDNL